MTRPELIAILPLLVLGLGTTCVMLQVAVHRSAVLTRLSTLLVLVVALAASMQLQTVAAVSVTPLLIADPLAQLFCAAFCALAAVCVLLSRDYLPGISDQGDEYYLLLLLATLGAVVLVFASHAASLLLGLELLSVSLYALIAYPGHAPTPVEAATKYLVLSGGASATMLFGFALLYTATGSLEFAGIGAKLGAGALGDSVLAAAVVLIVAGLGFKLSAVPFHLWTPDVYQGAPAPVTAFLATVGKAAPFLVLYRLFISADLFRVGGAVEVLAVFAVLSMIVGNLLALLQSDLKRLLAYSSIAHIGYLLIVFIVADSPADRPLASEAAVFYLLAYLPTTLAAFALVTLLNTGGDGRDRASIDSLSGLLWRQPLLALLLMVALLSLAGIPLTAGFIGKFYLFGAAVAGAHWGLLSALVIGSGIGIYYYLRVIYQMTLPEAAASTAAAVDPGSRAVAVALIAVILLLGVLPQSLLQYLQTVFQVG